MSSRERQASGAAVAAPRTLTDSAGLPAPNRPNPNAEKASRAMLWEDFYRSASPAQQMELLSLAGRQGLLYAHQLPALPNGSRHPPPADTPPAVAVLSPF